MAIFTTEFANLLLRHILWNEAVAGVGDATGLRGSSTLGSLWLALHTADPGAAGVATTSECAYTGYARVLMARNNTAWAIVNNVASPVAAIQFPQCTGGSETALWGSIVTSASGSGIILLKGQLSPSIAIANLKTPRITTATTFTLTV